MFSVFNKAKTIKKKIKYFLFYVPHNSYVQYEYFKNVHTL